MRKFCLYVQEALLFFLALQRQLSHRKLIQLLPPFSYAVLNLQPGVPDSQIKAQYRTVSLLIHPDKSSNPLAPSAFDRLKKAQVTLLDTAARTHLDECIADARTLLLREHKLTVDAPEARQLYEEGSEMKDAWRRKTVEVLVDGEQRRRKQAKAQMQEEGREMRRVEEEVESRKRRREHETAWEDSREGRIGSWRNFKGGKTSGSGVSGAKDGGEAGPKKKKKIKVLG